MKVSFENITIEDGVSQESVEIILQGTKSNMFIESFIDIRLQKLT